MTAMLREYSQMYLDGQITLPEFREAVIRWIGKEASKQDLIDLACFLVEAKWEE